MELKLDGITKEFHGFTAVDQVSCRMRNGVYGLLGVNGAGKTTLMRMLCTLLKPTEGKITCDGQDIFEMDGEYRKRLGYLPQEFGFYPDFTVQDYLMYIASIKGLRQAVAKKRVMELLQRVGLAKVVHKKMKKLSGGMKRRVGIAQAMLNDPEILILDEPTEGIQPSVIQEIGRVITELKSRMAVLIVEQYLEFVMEIADYCYVMENGRIIMDGEPEELDQEKLQATMSL